MLLCKCCEQEEKQESGKDNNILSLNPLYPLPPPLPLFILLFYILWRGWHFCTVYCIFIPFAQIWGDFVHYNIYWWKGQRFQWLYLPMERSEASRFSWQRYGCPVLLRLAAMLMDSRICEVVGAWSSSILVMEYLPPVQRIMSSHPVSL